jgi:hypothetical protein
VLPQLLVIIKDKASVVITPFELAFLCKLAYLSSPGPPLYGVVVVVRLKSAHNNPSEIKNIIGN